MPLFESSSNLSNAEISALQKEAKSESLSDDMRSRLQDVPKFKLFLQEYSNYLDRSRNETSRRMIDGLFRNVLWKFAINVNSIEDAQAYVQAQSSPNTTETSNISSENINTSQNSEDNYTTNSQSEIAPQNSESPTIPTLPTVPQNSEQLHLAETIDMPHIIEDGLWYLKSKWLNMINSLKSKSYIDFKSKQERSSLSNQDIDRTFWAIQSWLFEDVCLWLDDIYKNMIHKAPIITPENVNNPNIKQQFIEFCKEMTVKLMQYINTVLSNKISKYESDTTPDWKVIYQSLISMKTEINQVLAKWESIWWFEALQDPNSAASIQANKEFWKAYDQIIQYYSFIKGQLGTMMGERLWNFQQFAWSSHTNFDTIEPHKEEISDISEYTNRLEHKKNIFWNDSMFSESSNLEFWKEGKRTTLPYNDDIKYSFSKQKTSIFRLSPWESLQWRELYNNCIERITENERWLLILDQHGKFNKFVIQQTTWWEKEYYTGSYEERWVAIDYDTKKKIQTMSNEINEIDLQNSLELS